MKLVIPGGSGHVGAVLERAFAGEGHEVVVLTRGPVGGKARNENRAARRVHWDGRTLGDWTREMEGADVLINLCGRSVNCRYNQANRREIIESRVIPTRLLGKAVAGMANPPRVWLQASTATIYAHTFGEANSEQGEIGGNEPGVPETWRFSIEVARAWESAFDELSLPKCRKVKMRSAMVMSPDRGSVFDTLAGLARKGLGGRAGDGRQFVSWIHGGDFTRALEWIIDRPEFEGAVNICSPNPLPNAEFMRCLRQALGIPAGLPAAGWMLELGAVFMRTETELILKSRRVFPARLLQSGFEFRHPVWAGAVADLAAGWSPEPRSRADDKI